MAIVHSLYPEAGRVSIDESNCTRCGRCARICPAEVLALEEDRLRVRTDSPFGCIACGHCMMVCPEGSITVSGRGLSPADLLPLPTARERATPAALEALMRARRSIRRFSDRELEPALLERVLEAASTAPMGIPPWDVGCVVVRGQQPVRELSGRVVDGYQGMLKFMRPWLLSALRPFLGRTTYQSFRTFILPLGQLLVEARRRGQDYVFYDAPAVLLFHTSPYADRVDAAIACTYAMLAAESLGLGSTMIGSAAPIIQRNRELSRSLGIPEGNKPAIALILGYPAVEFRRAIRRRFTGISTSE